MEIAVNAFSDDDFSGAQNGDEVKGTAKVTAVSFEIADTNVTVGNSAKKQGTLTVNPSTVTKAYATYTVENSDIATVSGTEKSFDVKAEKAGITKVNADITVYGKEVYKFESTGYIVVSPKDDDEDFDITEVDNTEAYINRLAKNGDLTGNLPLQVGEAIVDNKINVKTLSAKAVNLAESALSTDLNEYYSLTNEVQATDNRVTADGLLLSAYDPDVVAVENPDKSVKVKLVVSDLHADDKENYEKEDSICQFVAELTVDGKVTELNNPVWLTVTDDDFKKGGIYTVYDNGESVYVS